MYNRHYVYFVLFGNDRYHPECHFSACQEKFKYLKDARAFAKLYSNAYIFKAHFAADSGDILSFDEIF